MQNQNTITKTENKVLFDLGQTFMTMGAREALEESNQTASEFLERHLSGDWGIVCEDDKNENELSVKESFRILSAYKTEKGEKLWIITEANRVSTTILLPCEY
jgi:hypothetical protein